MKRWLLVALADRVMAAASWLVWLAEAVSGHWMNPDEQMLA